jgi:hypothetical protein
MKTTIFGNFVIETHVSETASGEGLFTMTARRLVETGLPLSAEEQEQLRHIGQIIDDVAAVHDARRLL